MPAGHIYHLWSLLWVRKSFLKLFPDKKKFFPVEKMRPEHKRGLQAQPARA